MQGRILQINISHGGVPKRPIAFGTVTPLGLLGDKCAHPQFHGGPRQALLIICNEVIEQLRAEGWPLYPGALGENITSQGLDCALIRVGQRFRLGEAIVEITKLRKPCQTLDPYGEGIQSQLYDAQVKAGDPNSPRWGRGGFYASVIRTGNIYPDDIIALIDQVV